MVFNCRETKLQSKLRVEKNAGRSKHLIASSPISPKNQRKEKYHQLNDDTGTGSRFQWNRDFTDPYENKEFN